jgi:outer membrane receptor for ferric coprogen and ferric-rhodotorulic acid
LAGVSHAQNAVSPTDPASASSPISSSAASGETVLPEVSVTAQSEFSAATEGSGSYTTPQMSTATKLPLSIRETPQSVTVITRQRIEDQNMTTVSDAMQNTPGIAVTLAQGGPQRERFNSRGFAIDNISFDGLPISLGTYGGDSLLADMAIYDRIEVVRGATGLMQGAGNPSATINLVRKRPTRVPNLSAEAYAGRWDRYGVNADLSGPLNAAGTLRGRAVAVWQDNKSFQDVVDNRRKTLYLIVEADIARNTLLTFSVSRQNSDNTSTWAGLPAALDGGDLKLPRSTFLGNKWDYWDKESTSAFASLERRFDSGWKANFSVNRVETRNDMFATYPAYSTLNGYYTQEAGKYDTDQNLTSYNFHADGPFQLLGRKHELSVGASRRTSDFYQRGGYATTFSGMDIYHWNHDAPKPTNFTPYAARTNERQSGFYATTRLNLAAPLKLILGARLDWYEYESKTLTTNARTGYKVTRNLTKYAGLIYDLDSRHSVYASYTDIFKPQSNYDISGSLLDPVVGKNHEIGIKGEYFGGALNASAAVFRMNQENLAMRLDDQSVCPSYPAIQCYRAAGLVRSQGVDLEIQGEITPNWQLAAGYTFVNKETLKDANSNNIGRASTDLPRRQFKLFTTYRLPGGQWRVGGGVNWQSEIYRKSTGFHSRQDAYAVVNLMAGYRFDKHLDIQLNVNNLFDKTYYRSISSSATSSQNVYGEPRSFMLTARYQF